MPFVFDPNIHAPNDAPKCPICLAPANVYKRLDENLFDGWCEVCGEVCITLSAAELARNQGKGYVLSGALKRRPMKDWRWPPVKEKDVERILKDAPVYTELERMDLTLAEVAKMTENPGFASQFKYSTHYPLVSASTPDEAQFYLRQLANEGYIEYEAAIAKMTMTGYKQVRTLQSSGKQSSIAFVAMWFDPSRDFIYDEAILPAIREAGYEPLRIDKFEHVNRIDDEIIGQIRRSRFMVADFTGQRAGIYFEAGFMLGLNRNVIWLCAKDEEPKVHFDTRQYNFIFYQSIADAKTGLFHRILAVEGEGPKIPNKA